MKVNTVLLNDLMKSMQKEAYTPPAPPAPPMDPNAAAMGGMPPQGAPMPMDPSGASAPGGMGGPMTQDPNAMAAAPQIDPNTGLLVGMPTSPDGSMGPPPADPNAQGAPPQGTPIMVTLEDLQTILQQAIDAGKGGEDSSEKGAPASEKGGGHLEQRVDAIENMLGTVLQSLGMAPPEEGGEAPAGPEGAVNGPGDTGMINEVPMATPAQAGPPQLPQAIGEGMTDEAAAAAQIPKTASERRDFIKVQQHKRGEDILKALRSFGVIR